jgi:hypothetical protein
MQPSFTGQVPEAIIEENWPPIYMTVGALTTYVSCPSKSRLAQQFGVWHQSHELFECTLTIEDYTLCQVKKDKHLHVLAVMSLFKNNL